MIAVPSLLVLAKAPVVGEVKTRLALVIGDRQALAVYEALLRITAAIATRWPGPVMVFGSGDAEVIARSALGVFPQQPQGPGGLGSRLGRAFSASGLPAIAIGSDCPGLSLEHLLAIAAGLDLERAAVALGPATDGGYWAIGIREPACVPVCCDDSLPWSTPQLCQDTGNRLRALGHPLVLGPRLSDLDDADDLAAAERAGFRWSAPPAG